MFSHVSFSKHLFYQNIIYPWILELKKDSGITGSTGNVFSIASNVPHTCTKRLCYLYITEWTWKISIFIYQAPKMLRRNTFTCRSEALFFHKLFFVSVWSEKCIFSSIYGGWSINSWKLWIWEQNPYDENIFAVIHPILYPLNFWPKNMLI